MVKLPDLSDAQKRSLARATQRGVGLGNIDRLATEISRAKPYPQSQIAGGPRRSPRAEKPTPPRPSDLVRSPEEQKRFFEDTVAGTAMQLGQHFGLTGVARMVDNPVDEVYRRYERLGEDAKRVGDVVGKALYSTLPLEGLADAFGWHPKSVVEWRGFEDSFYKNLKNGNVGDAALQAVGVGADAGQILAAILAGSGAVIPAAVVGMASTTADTIVDRLRQVKQTSVSLGELPLDTVRRMASNNSKGAEVKQFLDRQLPNLGREHMFPTFLDVDSGRIWVDVSAGKKAGGPKYFELGDYRALLPSDAVSIKEAVRGKRREFGLGLQRSGWHAIDPARNQQVLVNPTIDQADAFFDAGARPEYIIDADGNFYLYDRDRVSGASFADRPSVAKHFGLHMGSDFGTPSGKDELLRQITKANGIRNQHLAEQYSIPLSGVSDSDDLAGGGRRMIDVLMARYPAPVWYSPTLRAVEESKTNSATAEQWLATIKKSPGVKEEELEWIGVRDWLESRIDPPLLEGMRGGQQKITREELLDFIHANQIEVIDVVKSGRSVDETREADVYVGQWDIEEPDPDYIRDNAREAFLDEALDEVRERNGLDDIEDLTLEQREEAEDLAYRWAEESYYNDDEVPQTTAIDVETGDSSDTYYATYAYGDFTIRDASGAQIYEGRRWHDEAEIRRIINDHLEDHGLLESVDDETATEWGAFQLPGGDDYHELLLRWNVKPRHTQAMRDAVDRAKQHIADRTGMSVADVEKGYHRVEDRWFVQIANEKFGAMIKLPEDAQFGRQKPFTISSHWGDEEDIIVHARFNTRTVDGKKVLFLEEIQSDWHQIGRDYGYESVKAWQDAERKVKLNQASPQVRNKIRNLTTSDASLNPNLDVYVYPGHHYRLGEPASKDQIKQWIDESMDTVPDAPFKTSYSKLALRRMIRWAAENGYDEIAWTTGKQQINRWEASYRQNVKSIAWEPFDASANRNEIIETGSGNFIVMRDELRMSPSFRSRAEADNWLAAQRNNTIDVDIAGERTPIKLRVDRKTGLVTSTESKLNDRYIEEVLGKGVAEKIMAAPDGGRLEGDDLTLGGRGFENFYDEKLVFAGNDLGKKYNSRVGSLEIQTGNAPRYTAAERAEIDRMSRRLDQIQEEHIQRTGMHASRYWLIDNVPEARELQNRVEAIAGKARARGETVHSMPITPELRRAAMRGQQIMTIGAGAIMAERFANAFEPVPEERSVVYQQ